MIKEGFQWWPPRAFQGWPAILTRLTGWRWCVQSGVQAQSGDEGDGFTEGLAAVEQIQHGVAVVPHQHQWALGQPATQLHDHLSGPVGEFLVAASLLLVVPRRGRQHGEHRQSPMASGPGHLAQPHQGDPAQPAGFDQLMAAGTHRVPVDGPRPDLGAPTPFQGFVDAEDQGAVATIAVATIEVLEQQHQQDAGYLTGGPHRPIEHLVVTSVVAVATAAHDAQRRGHGALAPGSGPRRPAAVGLSAKLGW